MGISSFSTQYLPRNLRALGILVLFFGILFAWGAIRDSSLSLLMNSFVFLLIGIMWFSLAVGVSRKERWASIFVILLMGLGIIGVFIQAFLTSVSLSGLIGIVILVLLLISFIRSLKEATVKSISIIPFIITIIGFCLVIASWVFLIVLALR